MFGDRIRVLLWMVLIMWATYLLDTQLRLNLLRFGILPRDTDHLIGVLAWPFLHANLAHLASNTVSLLALGTIVSLRTTPKVFMVLSLLITIYAGLGVWIAGRGALHIGASGLVFGYFGYILSRAIYDGRISSVIIATAVIVFFGGMIWGILPSDKPISWEGHLFGFLAGVLLAVRQKPTRSR